MRHLKNVSFFGFLFFASVNGGENEPIFNEDEKLVVERANANRREDLEKPTLFDTNREEVENEATAPSKSDQIDECAPKCKD